MAWRTHNWHILLQLHLLQMKDKKISQITHMLVILLTPGSAFMWLVRTGATFGSTRASQSSCKENCIPLPATYRLLVIMETTQCMMTCRNLVSSQPTLLCTQWLRMTNQTTLPQRFRMKRASSFSTISSNNFLKRLTSKQCSRIGLSITLKLRKITLHFRPTSKNSSMLPTMQILLPTSVQRWTGRNG